MATAIVTVLVIQPQEGPTTLYVFIQITMLPTSDTTWYSSCMHLNNWAGRYLLLTPVLKFDMQQSRAVL